MVGDRRAFIAYVSPNQVNAQIPSDVATGFQQITVSTAAGISAPFRLEIAATQPGMLAPPSFRIDGRQHAAATIGTTGMYALPVGAIPGIASRPARPGETLTLYAVGLGPVVPAIQAGEIARQTNIVSSQVEVLFGERPASILYSGLTMLSVGLYQLNVMVPQITESGAIRLSILVGSTPVTQELYTVVEQ
jgi:uncharacterized protein (TIGR03437 family)